MTISFRRHPKIYFEQRYDVGRQSILGAFTNHTEHVFRPIQTAKFLDFKSIGIRNIASLMKYKYQEKLLKIWTLTLRRFPPNVFRVWYFDTHCRNPSERHGHNPSSDILGIGRIEAVFGEHEKFASLPRNFLAALVPTFREKFCVFVVSASKL